MFVELFKMTRPKNIVIAIITLVVGYALFGSFPDPYTYIGKGNIDHFVLFNPGWIILVLQAIGFAFAIGFANIQNDILDLDSDKMNRPERPLVTGKVSVKAARRAWIIMFALCSSAGWTRPFYRIMGNLSPDTSPLHSNFGSLRYSGHS